MTCPRCSSQNQDAAQFCTNCGGVLKSPVVQQPSPPISTPDNSSSLSNISSPWWKRQWIFIAGGIVLILLLGLSGFWLVAGRKSKSTQQQSSLPTSSQQSASSQDAKYEALWQEFVTKYGQNYDECLVDLTAQANSCQKPSGLTSNLKQNINILILLDSSGSMAQQVSGEQKMAVAKEVIGKFIEVVPANANVGLIAYGHKGSNSTNDKAVSCQGIEEIYPLGSLDKNNFNASLAKFGPTGWTPIAQALALARDKLAGFDKTTTSNLIYIVSDGEETCGGDVVSVAQSIKDAGFDLAVNIVGFAVSDVARNQLSQVAQITGGKYYDAKTSEEMRKVFGDYETYLKNLQQYISCLQKGNVNQWLIDGKKVVDSWLCTGRKSITEWSDIQKEIAKEKDYQKYTYLQKRSQERSKAVNDLRDAMDKVNKEQSQANLQALDKALEEAKKELKSGKQ